MPQPSRMLHTLLFALAGHWFIAAAAQGQPVLYVDGDATGPIHDGSTWCQAYLHLQDALAAAAVSGGAVDEIQTAQGVYKPDQGTNQTPGDREASFQLLVGVALRGGYAGCGAVDPDERDFTLYETVLSGDLLGDDPMVPGWHPWQSDNAYRVVVGSGTDESTALDGLTITASVYSGAGMWCEDASPTLANCTFRLNRGSSGGGMYNLNSGPTLTHCTFTENRASSGGGMASDNSSPTLINCTFAENRASFGGAGMFNRSGSNPTLINCTFIENKVDASSVYGGGMFNGSGSNVHLMNCAFIGNRATTGGGIYSDYYSGGVTLSNCVVVGNLAEDPRGSAIDHYNDALTVTNTILWGNKRGLVTDELAQLTVWDGSPYVTFSINYSLIQGLDTFSSGAGNIDGDPRFVDPGHWDDGGTPDGSWDDVWIAGGYHLRAGSPCIDAGDNRAVPPDAFDLDGDEDTTEPTPLDFDGGPRLFDDPWTIDTGQADPSFPGLSVVDLGVNEYQGTCASDEDCADGNLCTVDLCTGGICGYLFMGSGTACGDSTDDDCTDPDTCNDTGVCLGNHEPVGTACGDLADDGCSDPDTCDGAGACLANHAPDDTPCPDEYFCDGVEFCVAGFCEPGDPPCYGPGQDCDEDSDECVCEGDDCGVLFVDDSATGPTHDGLSWCTAFVDLQEALWVAQTYGLLVTEIHVAEGVYRPSRYAGPPTYRSYSFHLSSNLALRGGYAGCGAYDPDARDVETYESILSGDLRGDDGPGKLEEFIPCHSGEDVPLSPGCEAFDLSGDGDVDERDARSFLQANGHGENSYSVVTAGVSDDETAVIDGFTVKAGFAQWSGDHFHAGGGLDNRDGSPTVINCLFTGNASNTSGGAIHSFGFNVHLTLIDCTFRSNWAAGDGAGLYGHYGNATLTGCTFTDNLAAGTTWGGAMHFSARDLFVSDCTFTRNRALDGAAMFAGGYNKCAITDCTFIDNRADWTGGAIHTGGDPTLTNCTFRGNSANTGGAFYHERGSPTLRNCVFVKNSARYSGGALANSLDDMQVIDCLFRQNHAGTDGGAVRNYRSEISLTNCLVAGNTADESGGAIHTSHDGTVTLANCMLGGNAASKGGGIYVEDGDLVVTDTIVWGNTNEFGSSQGAQIGGRISVIDFSCVQGWTGTWGGTGNHGNDPLFTPGPAGCYYLSQTAAGQATNSPCLDTGSDSAANLALDTLTTRSDETTDSDSVDIGYHYPVTSQPLIMGDYDRDGEVNLADFAAFQNCFTAPGPTNVTPCCRIFDFVPDADVDLDDYATLAWPTP